jgi:antitoxin HicB
MGLVREGAKESEGRLFGGIAMDEVVIRLHVEPLAEGGFVATSPDVPGLIAEGRSVSEAASIARDVARKIVESCVEHGDPIPRALQSLSAITAPMDLLIPVEAD